jgi:malonyl-CoA decarboxylase
MANYVYRLDDLETNHEAYARTFRVNASRAIERLARADTRRAPATA